MVDHAWKHVCSDARPDADGYCNDPGNQGSANTAIHGMVYSSGHVNFNPINVTGMIVAFEIQLQASSSSYNYSPTYGLASPPPGFPLDVANKVVMIRKWFITEEP